MKMIKGITLQDQLAQNAICREEIARLEKIVEDLKEENEQIRQNSIAWQTFEMMLADERKRTARSIFITLFNGVRIGTDEGLSMEGLKYYAEMFGVEEEE